MIKIINEIQWSFLLLWSIRMGNLKIHVDEGYKTS